MTIALVDIQGFIIDNIFHPKELTIQIGSQTSNFLFKPPIPYANLSGRDKKTANYVQKFIHGIPYDSGDVEYSEINSILEKYLLHSAEYIYVRGNQKAEFLQTKCQELAIFPAIYDVVRYDGSLCSTENFEPIITRCPHHATGKYMCTKINVNILRHWLYNVVLPR